MPNSTALIRHGCCLPSNSLYISNAYAQTDWSCEPSMTFMICLDSHKVVWGAASITSNLSRCVLRPRRVRVSLVMLVTSTLISCPRSIEEITTENKMSCCKPSPPLSTTTSDEVRKCFPPPAGGKMFSIIKQSRPTCETARNNCLKGPEKLKKMGKKNLKKWGESKDQVKA